ncbi:MAG: gfo/Idh/MocA family oxidoreductase, partial [Pirellula sp.]
SGKAWEPISSAGIGKPEPRSDGSYEGGHIAAINDLIDCAETNRPTKCSAHDARAIVQMIAAVFESHRVGASVEFPLKTRENPLELLKRA